MMARVKARRERDLRDTLWGVRCLWQYRPPGGPAGRPGWSLASCCPVNDDGCPLASFTGDRTEPAAWMYCRDRPDDDDSPRSPVLGRAVTLWSIEDGVRLLELHPPDYPEWLGCSFVARLGERPDAFLLLAGGHELRDGTVRAARRWLNLA